MIAATQIYSNSHSMI